MFLSTKLEDMGSIPIQVCPVNSEVRIPVLCVVGSIPTRNAFPIAQLVEQ